MTGYIPKLRKLRVSKHAALQKACIDAFCHSDKSSSIDSNSRKVIIVDKIKHAARVWGVAPVDEQFQLFIQSETLKTHRILNPELVIPLRSYFYANRCTYVLLLVMQSCVDIYTSGLLHYTRSIGKYTNKRKNICEKLDSCDCEQYRKLKGEQWQSYLNCHPHDLIEFSCCPKVPQPIYTYGAGSTKINPKLINWDCVRNECNHCGIQSKIDPFK